MEVDFERNEESGWKRKGRPPSPVPEKIKVMADRTYQTGRTGRAKIEPGEEDNARELRVLLERYAKQRRLLMRVQTDGKYLRWRMYDPPKKG